MLGPTDRDALAGARPLDLRNRGELKHAGDDTRPQVAGVLGRAKAVRVTPPVSALVSLENAASSTSSATRLRVARR